MKNSFSIIISFIALSIVGAAFIPLLNIQLKPDRSLPTLSVSYSWYNASAKLIEQEATSKLEGVFSSIQHVEHISSVSSRGQGNITIEFKKGADLDALRFELATRIRQIYQELPEELSYPVVSKSAGNDKRSPLVSYQINAAINPSDIEHTVKQVFVSEISLTDGVNNVSVYGAMPKEWVITYKVAALETHSVSSSEIASAIREYFSQQNLGTGSFHVGEGERQAQVKLQQGKTGKLDWESIPIKKVGKRIIRLKELTSDIRYVEKKPQAYYRINGLNTINLVVYPEKGVNTITLAKAVNLKLRVLQQNLPPSFSVIKVFDASEELEKELDKIGFRALFSLLILLAFVLLVTRKLNYLLLIVFSITANLLVAFIAYYFLGIQIQLYSLAGITISFGMVIDNSVIMIDHYLKTGRRDVFLPILAASLTTIGSLSVIFFLKEEQRANLVDFAWVIMLNLAVSLVVALFFIPALLSKIPVRKRKMKRQWAQKTRKGIANMYLHFIAFNRRFRWVYFLLLLLGFGIPFHMLPEKIEKEGFWPEVYNKSFGNKWFYDELKPTLEKWTGGTFRLFSEHVSENSVYSEPQRTKLYVMGTMPDGCTVHQLNDVIGKMENYLSRFDEIEKFQTSVRSHKNSQIVINFKPEHEKGSFPYILKGMITSKAIVLGGLDWTVYGVGRGFNNSVGTGFRNNRIILKGYNFDRLLTYAEELKGSLKKNSRVQDIAFESTNWWDAKPSTEYNLAFKHDRFALYGHKLSEFYSTLQEKLFQSRITSIPTENRLADVVLKSDQTNVFDLWHLKNQPLNVNGKSTKFPKLASIKKDKTGLPINKKDQQYSIAVAFNFTGPEMLAKKVTKKFIDQMNAILPLGYKCERPDYSWWNQDEKSQYLLIFLVALIIFIICSVLFESFSQPLAIIGMIPVSFIGVFLTFYLFGFNFDQGGFASFVLLSGITVNAGIYIISEFNRLRNESRQSRLSIYMQAFGNKITPVFLTIVSTLLGLVPFVYTGHEEAFWFAFAVGSIGGLLFSFVAVFVYLPVMLKIKG